MNHKSLIKSAFTYISIVILVFFLGLTFSYISFKNPIRIEIASISYHITAIGILYIVYFILRSFHAYLYHEKITYNLKYLKNPEIKKYKVGICIAVLNERLALFEKTIKSCLAQSHSDTVIYIVDDGSENFASLAKMIQKYQTNYKGSIKYFKFKTNKGKREAMYKAFTEMEKDNIDFVLTVDSDTVLRKKNVQYLIATIILNDKYGSVTGHVLSRNMQNGNLLQKMIGIRYVLAFNWERAAQANVGNINCNSGPLTLYRMEAISKVKEDFVNQYFLGRKATYGDDRHLTNKILEHGYQTTFQPLAIAFTDTPKTLGKYLQQQLRWSKSYIRELFWQIKVLHKHSFYMIFDFLMHIFLPIFIFFSLIYLITAIVNIFVGDHTLRTIVTTQVGLFLLLITISALLKAIFLKSYIYSKHLYNLNGYKHIMRYVVIYAFLYMFVLILMKPLALISLFNTSWSTR